MFFSGNVSIISFICVGLSWFQTFKQLWLNWVYGEEYNVMVRMNFLLFEKFNMPQFDFKEQ